jgi:hypothetical protein
MILECKDWRQALRFCEIRDDCSDSDDPNESIGYEQCSILQMCLDPDISGNAACKETTPFRELIKEMPGLRLLIHTKNIEFLAWYASYFLIQNWPSLF